jgi:general secretion pathway protein C
MTTVSISNRLSSAAIWRVRILTFVLAGLAAASVVFWGLQMSAWAPVQMNPTSLKTFDTARVDAQALGRVLGVSKQAEAPGSRALATQRWTLTGVARAGTAQGVALIAADGQPAKLYRLKSPLEEGLFLVALEPRKAHLGPSSEGPVTMTLELPKLREP